MASLKDLRTRITSVKSTRQITSAMKMVSAAKLKRAQDAILQMRPYANKMKEMLQNVSATLDDTDNKFSQVRDENKILLVVITSNRGLCGGFNSNVIKATRRFIRENADKNIQVLCLGKKAYDAFRREKYIVQAEGLNQEYNDIFDDLNYDNTVAIAEAIMNSFAKKQFDKVLLIYNQFKNAATQLVQEEQFLPLTAEESAEETAVKSDYIFEPSEEEIVEDLIPKTLKIQLYKALLDSNASEHGARMTAMHQATDNATDLINNLTLEYNKLRQAAITTEILEIVAGAEALG